nr:hypothetical protein [Tanacetum cinerariifolium]
MKNEEDTQPSGFSTLTPLPSPNIGELPPITTSTFTIRSPKNTPLAKRASISANPYPVISPSFVESNYEVLESILKDRRRQVYNEDLRTELDYYSEEYDKEREMEPRPLGAKETTFVLQIWVKRESDDRRPSERRSKDGGSRGVNLPPLLAAHRGRRGNLPPNSTYLSHNAPPFIPNSLQPLSNGHVRIFVNPYSQRNANMTYRQPPAYLFLTPGDSARIWWNREKAGSVVNYECLKAKFQSHFSQHKKFTKTHLTVHNIKQRDGESTRAFITRYTDDTLEILRLHEEKHIFSFVHRLKTRSLMEFLFTDLPTTYKVLMEKTYTLIEAKEVATNGAPNDHKEGFNRSNKGFSWDNNIGNEKTRDRFSPYKESDHGLLTNLSKSPKEILVTEKVAQTFKQRTHMVRSRGSCDMSKYCHFHDDDGHETNQCQKLRHQIEETVKSGKLAHLVKGIKKGMEKASDTQLSEWKKGEKDIITKGGFQNPTRWLLGRPFLASRRGPSRNHHRGNPYTMIKTLNFVIVRSNCPYNMLLERTTMQKMGIVVSIIHKTIKFHTPCGIGTVFSTYEPNKLEKGQKKTKETIPKVAKNVLSCANTKERIIINEKYPKKKPEEYKIFNDQIGQNFKAYVDDMGPFLGHLITKQGIIANPLKVKEITDLKPPRTLKEIQSLNGKLADLSRFFSKGADKSLLFFKALKREHDIKFEGHDFVKGHILAEFLVETPFIKDKDMEIKKPKASNKAPNSKNTWKLYTDRASSSNGSGAGLILVSPKAKEYIYALRDAAETIQDYTQCQAYSIAARMPNNDIVAVNNTWPFSH